MAECQQLPGDPTHGLRPSNFLDVLPPGIVGLNVDEPGIAVDGHQIVERCAAPASWPMPPISALNQLVLALTERFLSPPFGSASRMTAV